MKKYRKFYIDTEAYVVFTENEKQYTRKLFKERGKMFIRFKNQKIEILAEDLV